MKIKKPSPKTLFIVLFSTLGIFCIAITILGFYLGHSASTVQDQNQKVTTQKNKAEAKANKGEDFAKQVISLCNMAQGASRQELARSGLCKNADAVVQAAPTSSPSSPSSRGILNTYVKNGHLHIRYTDGSDEDKGSVSGSSEDKEESGKDPSSITGSSINQFGSLTITYSNGRQEVVGKVVGPQGGKGDQGTTGRGISSIDTTNGRLIVTYTDGQVIDLGPLPAGPQGEIGPQGERGPQGEVGPQGPTGKPISGWTETDPDGKEKVCSRRAESTDDNPTYECHYTSGSGGSPQQDTPAATPSETPPSN